MAKTQTRQALEAASVNANTLAAAISSNHLLVIAQASDIQSLDLTNDSYKAVLLLGNIFTHDASDSTSAHDGITVLVSSDGKRFLAANSLTIFGGVISATTATPPASPSSGDRYRVPSAPTGDWVGEAGNIAVYNGAGWVFATPKEGYWHHAADTDVIEVYKSTGWENGFSASTISDGAILPTRLSIPLGISVENATTTSPPGMPSQGVAYLVASGGSGDWSGEDGNIAIYEGSAWKFLDAYEGARVYDKNADATLVYESGVWEAQSSSPYLGVAIDGPNGNPSAGLVSRNANSANAPTTTNQTSSTLLASVDYAAKSTGSKLVITMEARVWPDAVVTMTDATATMFLFIDSASSPADSGEVLHGMPQNNGSSDILRTWRKVVVLTPTDTNVHNYRLRVAINNTNSVNGNIRPNHAGAIIKVEEIKV